MSILDHVKPSDIIATTDRMPYSSVFGRSEREFSMLALIFAAQKLGDTWEPRFLANILDKGPVMEDAKRGHAEGGACIWLLPMLHFDFPDLVKHCYAQWHGDPPAAKIAVTDIAVALLVKHGWTKSTCEEWTQMAHKCINDNALEMVMAASKDIAAGVIAGGRRR